MYAIGTGDQGKVAEFVMDELVRLKARSRMDVIGWSCCKEVLSFVGSAWRNPGLFVSMDSFNEVHSKSIKDEIIWSSYVSLTKHLDYFILTT